MLATLIMVTPLTEIPPMGTLLVVIRHPGTQQLVSTMAVAPFAPSTTPIMTWERREDLRL